MWGGVCAGYERKEHERKRWKWKSGWAIGARDNSWYSLKANNVVIDLGWENSVRV